MKPRCSGLLFCALCLALGCLFGLTHPCVAAYTNESSVVDAAGDWSAGGSYSNINAVAQPSGVSTSRTGQLLNYAGFLSTFSLRPDLDTDGNGIPDELDPDNDGDALEDTEELSGSAFSPITATDVNDPDTDGDGMSDGDEALSGTNPQDTNSLLVITEIGWLTNGYDVTWLARSNVTYEVYFDNNLTDTVDFVSFDTVTVTAVAAAPWYAVSNTYSDLARSGTSGFYQVRINP